MAAHKIALDYHKILIKLRKVMKMLVKTLGGSTAYGLNTPESDLDYRGVFVNTDPSKILGL